MWMQFNGLFLFILTLLPLVLLQRLLHREIQAVLLILSRDRAVTIGIFSIIFLPGVLLHECSHYFMAAILGVRTGNFSLFPRTLPGGRLQMGYVETSRTDIVRDSLIGAAPLVAGGLFVAYAAISRLQLVPLWEVLRNGQSGLFWLGLQLLPQVKDFPLWFYLTFAVSSTMMPSGSDRHAWLPLGASLILLLMLALVGGAGPWMLEHVGPPTNAFLGSVATVFGLSAAVHMALILPFAAAHRLVAGLTGVDVT
jgi:hypothetical protein